MLHDWTKESVETLTLELKKVPEEQRVKGFPSTGSMSLGHFGGLNVGVWEMTPGTMRDAEVDEIFFVVHGSATVSFENGDVIVLAAGDIARLHAGQRTVWTVTEALRKVYLTLPS
jgi:uncharacterized protein